LAANSVGLGGRLSITAPANASALSSSGYSLTGSNASSMIDLAGTLNTTGSPALIKLAVSNTASGGSTKFLSLLAGASGTTEIISFSLGGRITATDIVVSSGVKTRAASDTSPGLAMGASDDVMLFRDAANTLALRNSTNAQAFNIYNTYTSGSVYERGFMRWVSDVLEIGTEHVGASARGIVLKVGSTAVMTIPTSGRVEIAGGINTGIGNTSAFQNISAIAINLTGGTYNGTTMATLFSPSDGVLRLTDSSVTSFNRVCWGGTTSSFPSIKRSTTLLQARLADDSDFATYQGKLRVHANATSETVTPTHTLRLFDAAGTEYRVPAIAV